MYKVALYFITYVSAILVKQVFSLWHLSVCVSEKWRKKLLIRD